MVTVHDKWMKLWKNNFVRKYFYMETSHQQFLAASKQFWKEYHAFKEDARFSGEYLVGFTPGILWVSLQVLLTCTVANPLQVQILLLCLGLFQHQLQLVLFQVSPLQSQFRDWQIPVVNQLVLKGPEFWFRWRRGSTTTTIPDTSENKQISSQAFGSSTYRKCGSAKTLAETVCPAIKYR